MFFMQHPSFLDFQRHLYDNLGKNNTQGLFGMKKIPTDNHIRNMLDGAAPDYFAQHFFDIIADVVRSKVPIVKNVLGGYTLIALDGTEYFTSQRSHAQPAQSASTKMGRQTTFMHILVLQL